MGIAETSAQVWDAFPGICQLELNSPYGIQVEVCAAISGQHADLPRAFSLVLLYRMFPPTYRGQKPRKKDWLTVLGRFLLTFMYDSVLFFVDRGSGG